MIISRIYNLIDSSNCHFKRNLKDVIRKVRNDDNFFVFFINILIDYRINSLDESHFLAFLDSYSEIPINTLSDEEVAEELHSQLKSYFGTLMLRSKFTFFPYERHINVITHDTFHREHYPMELAVTPDDIYNNPQEFIKEKIEDLGGVTVLRLPYRSVTYSGVKQKRIIWLARYYELDDLVSNYALDKGIDKETIWATAVNDILGLGFSDANPDHDKTLLIYLVFPKTFGQLCYKPTFVEGSLWNYKETFFLSSINNSGYGSTRSTNKGIYRACECVADGIENLSDDFELGILGYAEAVIDKSNIVNEAVERLFNT